MKKFLLTASAVGLLYIAGLAQNQQQNENTNYRTMPKTEQADTTDTQNDKAVQQSDEGTQDQTNMRSNRSDEGSNDTQSTQSQDQNLNQDQNSNRDEDTDQNNQQQDVNQAPMESTDTTAADDQSSQSSQYRSTTQGNDQGAAAENNTQGVNQNEQGDQNSSAGLSNEAAEQHPVEVVEDKEGPNNEVVYKYQGEMYYVDREQQKLVKADESQLKDAKNKPTVVQGTANNENRGTKHHKRSKG